MRKDPEWIFQRERWGGIPRKCRLRGRPRKAEERGISEDRKNDSNIKQKKKKKKSGGLNKKNPQSISGLLAQNSEIQDALPVRPRGLAK